MPPALATLKPKPPVGGAWVHEIKFDGYRLQAQIRGGTVKLLTRSGQDWSERFGDGGAGGLGRLAGQAAILDGELIVEGPAGASDFSALQADLSAGRSDRFRLYLFDLLYLDGADLRGLPLEERKARLAALLKGAQEPIRFSEHFVEDGEIMLQHACRLSLEGIVSKRLDGRYPAGRSGAWIKSKCSERQEFVIAGYVPSTADADLVGSLVLGVMREGKLAHVGRVGTGFSRVVARDLAERLEAIGRKTAPFAEKLTADAVRGVRWVQAGAGGRGGVPRLDRRRAAAACELPRAARGQAGARGGARDAGGGGEAGGEADASRAGLLAGGRGDQAVLAEWYVEAWPRMAPHLVNRPVALLRCPGGWKGQCFFQKHAWKGQARTS